MVNDHPMIAVLCIDEDERELILVKQFLESDREIHVETASSFTEVLNSLKKNSIDVIVSEYLTMDTEGACYLTKLRSMTALPVILYTGKSNEQIAIRAMESGVAGYIRKGDNPASRFSDLLWKIRDIVQQQKDVLLLRENEAKYRELIENANIIILKTDKDSKITFFNEYAQEFFGFSEPEILGQPLIGSIIPVRGSDTFLDMDYFVKDIAIQPNQVMVRELENVRKNGDRVWISWRNKPVCDGNNNVTGIISFGTDMTERRTAEHALFQANKKLNLLNSITRHDILNQLTVLGGYIELSKSLTKDRGLHGFIEQEKKATKAIRRMINFTKDYQDVGLYRPQWQNLNTLVHLLAKTVDLGPIELKSDLGNLEVYADPLFEKVIYTLLDNAIRHGKPLKSIRFSYERLENGCLVICEDTGVGIPADEKEKIFLRGYGKHTGFGLFLSREILGITGFAIQETGIPGKGARFEIFVPEGGFRTRRR